MCSVTTKADTSDPFRIELRKDAIGDGHLPHDSFIRPSLLMTVHRSLILWKQGVLPSEMLQQVRDVIVGIVTGSIP